RQPCRARLRGSDEPGRGRRYRSRPGRAARRAPWPGRLGLGARFPALAPLPWPRPAHDALAAQEQFARTRGILRAGADDEAGGGIVTPSLGQSVRKAVMWRSGSQIVAQVVAWGSTLAVVRILDPTDYGLFAMTQVVLAFLNFLNGYGFASSLIQERELDSRKIRQAFGILLLVNTAIALLQVGLAPLAAAWYRQPLVADMLRVQALIYLATPFIAIPEVLLIREMDFRRPAIEVGRASCREGVV